MKKDSRISSVPSFLLCLRGKVVGSFFFCFFLTLFELDKSSCCGWRKKPSGVERRSPSILMISWALLPMPRGIFLPPHLLMSFPLWRRCRKKSIRKSLSHEFSSSCHNVPHTHTNQNEEEGGRFHEAQIIFINCVSRNFGILVIDFQQAPLTVDDFTSLGTWWYDMSEATTRNHPSLSFSLNHYHYSMSFNTQTQTHIFHLFNSITSSHDTLDVVSGFCRRTFSLFLISFRSM